MSKSGICTYKNCMTKELILPIHKKLMNNGKGITLRKCKAYQ